MSIDEVFLEVLKWLGGGGVALIGVFLTGKRHSTDKNVGLISDLQKQNEKYYERMDKQDEQIRMLKEDMDQMRQEMFKIQTDKHKSEVKNIELQSKNERLEDQKALMADEIIKISKEKDSIREDLEFKILEIQEELDGKIEVLVDENTKLKVKIEDMNHIKNNND